MCGKGKDKTSPKDEKEGKECREAGGKSPRVASETFGPWGNSQTFSNTGTNTCSCKVHGSEFK